MLRILSIKTLSRFRGAQAAFRPAKPPTTTSFFSRTGSQCLHQSHPTTTSSSLFSCSSRQACRTMMSFMREDQSLEAHVNLARDFNNLVLRCRLISLAFVLQRLPPWSKFLFLKTSNCSAFFVWEFGRRLGTMVVSSLLILTKLASTSDPKSSRIGSVLLEYINILYT